MPQPNDGGTPLELQAKILQGLLSSSRRVASNNPVKRELPIKDLLPALLVALSLAEQQTRLAITGQVETSLISWWDQDNQSSIAIRLAHNDQDDSPNYVMLPTSLVSDLLVLSLGGTPVDIQMSRLPSRMELKFANRLGPALANALSPMLRTKTNYTSAWQASAKEVRDMLTEQPIELIKFNLEWENRLYDLSIAFAETKIERRVVKQLKTSEKRRDSTVVAAEIGKTSISVNILLKLADQTLDHLQKLKVGDVLPLTPNSLLEARMQVRGQDIYIGQIGRLAQNFGFKVTRTAQKSVSGLRLMVSSLTSEGDKK